ncbi:MAG TPA: nuclear transport factor 2 family protein [Segetibacter sp.]|jgi:ketosteroid isomerase-like protein
MKRFALILLLFFPLLCYSQTKDEQAIKAILDEQTKAWNNGDLESFMKGYWESDSLLFIGKSGPKYGYRTTLENYRKSYPDTAAMGKLHFDILQVKRLSVIYFFVVGKWHLQRTIGDVEGHFTLLVKKVKNKWVIVADHSS